MMTPERKRAHEKAVQRLRDKAFPPPTAERLQLMEDRHNLSLTVRAVVHWKNRDWFGVSYRELAEALALNYHEARNMMHRLERGGVIELADGDRRTTCPPRYRWVT